MSFPRQYRRTITPRASAAGDQARARVLDVALELFAASGYRGTSIAEIAERAGLSQSGLLHHFPSKTALLVAALDHREEVDASALQIDDEPSLGWAAFDSLIDLAERNGTQPRVVRLFVTLCAEAMDPRHPGHEWIINHYASMAQWLTESIRAGIQSGEMSADIPVESTARLTIATMDGLQIQWLAGAGQIDMAAEMASFVATLKDRWAT